MDYKVIDLNIDSQKGKSSTLWTRFLYYHSIINCHVWSVY